MNQTRPGSAGGARVDGPDFDTTARLGAPHAAWTTDNAGLDGRGPAVAPGLR